MFQPPQRAQHLLHATMATFALRISGTSQARHAFILQSTVAHSLDTINAIRMMVNANLAVPMTTIPALLIDGTQPQMTVILQLFALTANIAMHPLMVAPLQ
jgi:hypothetical protein